MAGKYQLLVFDWDGTLMDSEARIVECMRRSFIDLGLEPGHHDELKQVIGLGLREALEALLPGHPVETHERMTHAYRKYWLETRKTGSEMFGGMSRLIGDLNRSGYLLAVATGKSRRGLKRQFEETGLGQLFHASRCADECRSKPAPDMLLEIMQELEVLPEQTLMIGDTGYDLGMAQAAGCDAIGVTYGVHDRHQLEPYEPLCLIESPEELAEWLTCN